MRRLTIILIICFPFITYGQEDGPSSSDIPNINELVSVPSSPEAQAFTKYGNVPVSLYTGTPNISLPLHVLKGRELEIPISLTYDASGVRVDQISTWVGLGWNLNAGGVVSRQVNGLPDDYLAAQPYIYAPFYSENNFHTYQESVNYFYERAKTLNMTEGTSHDPGIIEEYFEYQKQVLDGRMETQPDTYSFNVNGLSGTMYIDYETGEAYCVEHPDIEVVAVLETADPTKGGSRLLSKWIIRDAGGNEYWFEMPEKTFAADLDASDRNRTYYSSWFLTQVVSKSRKDVIEFVYSTAEYWQTPQYAGRGDIRREISNTADCEPSNIFAGSPEYRIEQFDLTSITVNGSVAATFTASTEDRKDLAGKKALREMYFYELGELINRYDLIQSYFGNPESASDYRSRLKLDALYQFGSDASASITPQIHLFEYFQGYMPPRNSMAVDYWGYYNGALTNNTLIPSDPDLDALSNFNAANREPSEEHAIIGTLKSIRYPTGGVSEFTFQLPKLTETSSGYEDLYAGGLSLEGGIDSDFLEYLNCDDDTQYLPQKATSSFSIPIDGGGTLVGAEDYTFNLNVLGTSSQASPVKFIAVYKSATERDLCELINGVDVAYHKVGEFTDSEETISLLPGTYQVVMLNNVGGVTLDLTVTKRTLVSTTETKDIGGLRISKIVDQTDPSNPALTKYYYYDDLSLQSASSVTTSLLSSGLAANGILQEPVKFDEGFTQEKYTDAGAIVECQFITRFSSNRSVKVGKVISYNTVSEVTYGQNGFNGFTVYDFYNEFEGATNSIPYIKSNLLNGQIKKERIYDSEMNLLREKENFFTQEALNNGLSGYLFQSQISTPEYFVVTLNGQGPQELFTYQYDPPQDASNFEYFIDPDPCSWDDVIYCIRPPALRHVRRPFLFADYWMKLNRVEEHNYDGGGDVFVTTTYSYENLEHRQVTKTEYQDSRGTDRTTVVKYPHDLGLTALTDLHRIAEPVRTEIFNGTTKVSTQETTYDSFYSMELPSSIQASIADNPLETRINFNDYNAEGNPVEISKANDMRITYLWGYNGLYPVAKIENATYATVTGALVANGTDATFPNYLSDAAIESKIQVLRDNLTESMVYGYTYQRGVGVTAITDPNGKKNTFRYDSFNRLDLVKDQNEHITQKYEYQYVSPSTTLNLSGNSISADASGGFATINVTSDVNWTIGEDATWISVTPSSGSNNGAFAITYTSNTSGNSRTGTITVSGGGISRTVVVVQAGTSALGLSKNQINPTASAGSSNVDITSNVDWSITDDASWITVFPTEGNGNGGFAISYTENTSTASRTATVTVNGEISSETVTVIQAGVQIDNLALSSNSLIAPQTAGSGTIDVTSNVSWTVTDNVGWITVSPTNGSNNGSFTITYTANGNTSSRNGTVTVTGGGLTETVSVTQAGSAANLALSATSHSPNSSSGSTTIDVTSNVSWTVSDNVGWITVSPTTGSNNGSFTITYTANGNTSSRNGTVTVTGGGLTETVSVSQAGSAANLALSATNHSPNSSSGSTTIDVTSNVSWTVSDNVGWITVSPTSGSNNGSFTITYTANGNTSSRNGTVTVTGGGLTETVSVTQAGSAANLALSATSHSPNSSSGSTTIDVTSNVSWTVSDNVGWITVSPTSGSNNGSFTITYTANGNTSSRNGTVTVTGGGLTETVSVTQAGSAANLALSVTSHSPNSSSGSTTIDVTSNVSWTVSDNVGWITVSPTSGSNNGSFTITYTANSNTSSRTGTVTVTGGGVTETVTVTQGPAPSLSLSASSHSAGPANGSRSISVTSNVSWTVSDNVGWITVSPTSGSNNGNFTITYSAHTGNSSRTGTVTVIGGGLSRTVSVTQAAPNLSLSASSHSAGPANGSTSISVTSNVSWTVSDNVGWITVSPTSGSNNGNFTITYSAHTGSSSRSGTVTVTGGGLSRTVSVTQAAPNLSLSASSHSAGPANGSTSISVTSNVSWTVSDNVGWITVSPTSGSNNGSFTINYTAHTGTSSRSGTVTVTGGGLTRTVSVTQQAGSLSLSTSSINGVANGDSEIVTVTSNVSWSVTDNASWINVTLTSGSNNGTFTISFITNNSTSSRTGTVTVMGGGLTRTVTVTQAGQSISLTVSPGSLSPGSASGSQSITVTSNTSWTVSESLSWVTLSATSGSNNGSFSINYTTNTSTSPRSGTVTVSGGGITRNISVTQDGAATILTVSPTSNSVGATSGSKTIAVTANVSWTVSESLSWITLSATSGSNNGSFNINYTTNTSTSSRSGTVTVSGGGTTRSVSVTQAGAAPNLNVSPTSTTVAAASGSTTITVTSNLSWSVSESLGWITVSPTSGSNNGSFNISYGENPLANDRSGSFTVTGGGITRTINITQSGQIIPSLTAFPTFISHTSSGQTSSVVVTSNVTWSTSDNASWITVTPISGSNNSTISITTQSHSGTSSRSGTVTVSGSGISRTITVNQGGTIEE